MALSFTRQLQDDLSGCQVQLGEVEERATDRLDETMACEEEVCIRYTCLSVTSRVLYRVSLFCWYLFSRFRRSRIYNTKFIVACPGRPIAGPYNNFSINSLHAQQRFHGFKHALSGRKVIAGRGTAVSLYTEGGWGKVILDVTLWHRTN